MDERSHSGNELQRELAYYKQKLDELSGESIRHDYALSSLRFELKQKKEAFGVLSSLQKEITVATPLSEIFAKAVKAINTQLGMDRSVVLTASAEYHTFKVGCWYGFTDKQSLVLENLIIVLPADVLKQSSYLLLNKATEPNETSRQIQQLFSINYFVGVPILHDDKPVAFLLSGRQFEKVPFYQPLNNGDADTLMAIASLISMVLQNKKMVELRAEMIKQKEENSLISTMLAELKATQAQLVQREKMASLGELAAGIAHEIQNPLNFVNNFSEVNKELIAEMKEEIIKRNLEEIEAIANNIENNEQKISHHGKRADAIVKGMLQHSSGSAGQEEPTRINALANEYLKLSYHALRAKDKAFQAKIETHFDESLGKINIVPQEIGRVLLNLFNNAFYAVHQKKQSSNGQYEPVVSVSTKKEGNHIIIAVKDNGIGMSPKVVEKAFQPFFTTKPTGVGTGLGLSLSYDIITKGHGGTFSVQSTEGEGTEFVVQLPA